jgi:cysteine desulfurase/selenocysteine lyase
VPSEEEIIFTSGATDALNLLAYSYGMHFLSEGDEIILSEMEHHANIVPWQFVAQKTGAIIQVIPVDDIGELNLNVYEDLLNERTKIVSITHVSNVLGTVNPISKMSEMAHENGAIFIVDGCQAAPHKQLNMNELGVDFYTFSTHKMYGPTGFGILWGRKDLLDLMPPFKGGGDMINEVRFEKTSYNDLPHKFEAGTPPIVAGIASASAIDFIEEIGFAPTCSECTGGANVRMHSEFLPFGNYLERLGAGLEVKDIIWQTIMYASSFNPMKE